MKDPMDKKITRIKHSFIDPYIIDLHYDGFQIKVRQKNNTYTTYGQKLPSIQHVTTYLAHMLMVNLDKELTPMEYQMENKRITTTLDQMFVEGIGPDDLDNKQEEEAQSGERNDSGESAIAEENSEGIEKES